MLRVCVSAVLICAFACDATDPIGPGRDTGPPPPPQRDSGVPLDLGRADVGDVDLGAIDDMGARTDTGIGMDAGDMRISDLGTPDLGAEDMGVVTPCDRADPTPLRAYESLILCLQDAAPAADQQAALDRFIEQVDNTEGGFPIVEGDQVVFFYVARPEYDVEDDANLAEDFSPNRRLEPLRVAGDFNAWDDAALVMQPEALNVYHLRTTLDVQSSDRWRYKLIARDDAGADVYFSDPLSRRFDFDPLGRISIVRGGPGQGHLELIRSVAATALGSTRDIYLYIPPGYEQSASTYPVLFMHDGNNLFDPAQPRAAGASWEVDAVMELELAAGNVRPGLIVGVPNTALRFDEYTHTTDDIGSGPIGGRGDDYADFIVNDLKPLIDQRYRAAPGRENAGVLGSSLGGLISYHIGLLHPDVFRFVGGMSSTFGWGQLGLMNPTMIERYAMAANLASQDQIFYLDSGGGPGSQNCAGGDDLDNYCETIQMRDLLTAAGVNTFPDDPDAVPLTPAGINIYHYWTPQAPHNEVAWNMRLFRPLRLFLRP